MDLKITQDCKHLGFPDLGSEKFLLRMDTPLPSFLLLRSQADAGIQVPPSIDSISSGSLQCCTTHSPPFVYVHQRMMN